MRSYLGKAFVCGWGGGGGRGGGGGIIRLFTPFSRQRYVPFIPLLKFSLRYNCNFVFKTNLRALDFILVGYVEKRTTLPQNDTSKLMH